MPSRMIFLILDTEYTSWEGAYLRGWSGEGEHRELVQISSIKVKDLRTFNGSEFLSLYAKPRLNPLLSDYFKDLTGISQEFVDEVGFEIADVINLFADFSDGVHCFSWDNDIAILEENIDLLGNKFSLRIGKHTDVRRLFEFYGFNCEALSSGEISDRVPGSSSILPGNSHNALSDCVSIASAMHKLGEKVGYEDLFETMIAL